MAYNFPDSPTPGQVFQKWTWNGEAWVLTGPAAPYTKAEADTKFVDAAGDTMLGHLGLPTGPSATQAVRKDYVDGAISAIPAPDLSSKVSKAGDTMSGTLTVNADIYAVRAGGTTGVVFLGTTGRYLFFNGTDYLMPSGGLSVGSCLSISNAAPVAVTLAANGWLQGSKGYQCRTATDGGYGGNAFNFYYNATGSTVSVIIDNSYLGTIAMNSDYRIKKDIEALPGTWETVKALRPIRYSIQDYTPPCEMSRFEKTGGHFVQNDDTEQWGFIAHELQETLTKSAATGEKDMAEGLQSPNPWTVIAALTRTVQEMQARIEALETGSG